MKYDINIILYNKNIMLEQDKLTQEGNEGNFKLQTQRKNSILFGNAVP